jgi:hypothetical protein
MENNVKELFQIRPVNEKEEEFVITIGKHLATNERFVSRKVAQMRINKTDWNLTAALFYALLEAYEFEKNNKTEKVQNEINERTKEEEK